jgi:hypothetical protein
MLCIIQLRDKKHPFGHLSNLVRVMFGTLPKLALVAKKLPVLFCFVSARSCKEYMGSGKRSRKCSFSCIMQNPLSIKHLELRKTVMESRVKHFIFPAGSMPSLDFAGFLQPSLTLFLWELLDDLHGRFAGRKREICLGVFSSEVLAIYLVRW